VIRLARLTGRPNQSPPRVIACPDAAPTRSCGNSSPCSSAARERSTEAPSSATGSSLTYITASPMVLTSRDRRAQHVRGEVLHARGDVAELLGRHVLAEPREADQVGEPDADVAGARERAVAALGRARDLAGQHLAQVQLQRLLHDRNRRRGQQPRHLAEALRELALAQPGLERHVHRGPAHDDRGLPEPAAEHARDRQQVVLRHAALQELGRELEALQIGLAERALVRSTTGRPIARRSLVASSRSRPAASAHSWGV
jgi:hypothetical protein